MELSSRHVGIHINPFDLEVTPRHAMNYAAAVGDNNPVYFDDERQGGIIAPPMLCVALTWPVSEKFWQYGNSGDFPFDVLQRQVHYTETLEWNRPMRPGEKLRLEGEVFSIAPHQAGTHMVLRYRGADSEGLPVFTEYIGGLLRGVRCKDGAKGDEKVPPIPRYVYTGSPEWEQPIAIDPLAAHVYDACADIYFPIHTSVKFAHSVRLPRTILHGTATLSLAIREMTNREAGADPGRLKALGCRFTGMVIPGTTITVQLLSREVRGDLTDLHFVVLNHDGKKAISDGCLTVSTQPSTG
ncbi:MAG: MaoC family dehydratase N-terminal domain-containing protein [Candidatus Hydrogenedentes bacterium]|nr:MaoC family dehydratase N-terminal domain-containing protein [Candidatus Hydrogenedentota bacterium]